MNIIKTSRPRFWLYELGTFLIGVFSAVQFIPDPKILDVIIFSIYFLFPANLLIYGINDIFDYETDKLNSKKNDYEDLLTPDKHKKMYFWILLFNIPFIIYVFFALNVASLIWFLLFVLFATFYSAKPIRAKSKPFFDSFFSAGHYIATGAFGYFLVGGTETPWIAVLAGMLWAISMHAYSAVPDIRADKEGGLQTIATFLGSKQTIIMCGIFYTASFLIGFVYLGIISIILLIPYLVIIILSLIKNEEKEIFKIYKYFPYLNALSGMVIFFKALL